MERRRYLELLGLSSTLTLAGCASSNDNGDNPSGDNNDQSPSEPNVTPVSVIAEDHDIESPVNTMQVNYATDTVAEIQPPDAPARTADSGNKLVVLHGEVTVESRLEDQIDVYGSVLALQAGGIVSEGRGIRNMQSFTVTVAPGATFDAWTAFQVAEDASEATLMAVDVDTWFSQRTEVLFEADSSLSTSLPSE